MLHREVNLFDNSSFDKDFLWDLVVEYKLVPLLHSPLSWLGPSSSPSSPSSPSPNPKSREWCSFHKTKNSIHLPNVMLFDTKTIFAFIAYTYIPPIPLPHLIPSNNPSKINPSLFHMTEDSLYLSPASLFMHKCWIKQTIATVIMDNGIQKNMVSHDIV